MRFREAAREISRKAFGVEQVVLSLRDVYAKGGPRPKLIVSFEDERYPLSGREMAKLDTPFFKLRLERESSRTEFERGLSEHERKLEYKLFPE